MSALQFLREKAGVLVAGVIGLSLFLFVVSDFFGRGRGQRLKQKKYYEIGQISGEYISYQDYEQKLQNLKEIYNLSGRSNLDEATTETMREQTWQQMVREIILDPQGDILKSFVQAILREIFFDATEKEVSELKEFMMEHLSAKHAKELLRHFSNSLI